MIEIVLNGKPFLCEEGLTIDKFVKNYKYSEGVVIVKYNNRIVKKDEWCKNTIAPKDIVDLINFVGGG